jgi:hypothetical protein
MAFDLRPFVVAGHLAVVVWLARCGRTAGARTLRFSDAVSRFLSVYICSKSPCFLGFALERIWLDEHELRPKLRPKYEHHLGFIARSVRSLSVTLRHRSGLNSGPAPGPLPTYPSAADVVAKILGSGCNSRGRSTPAPRPQSPAPVLPWSGLERPWARRRGDHISEVGDRGTGRPAPGTDRNRVPGAGHRDEA